MDTTSFFYTDFTECKNLLINTNPKLFTRFNNHLQCNSYIMSIGVLTINSQCRRNILFRIRANICFYSFKDICLSEINFEVVFFTSCIRSQLSTFNAQTLSISIFKCCTKQFIYSISTPDMCSGRSGCIIAISQIC